MLVFRPIIERLRAAGHEVEVTARDYAQTLELLRAARDRARRRSARHGGASRHGKLGACCRARGRCAASASGRGFDLAVAHGSNDLALAARRARIPAVNMFDYEWATHAAPHRLPAGAARDDVPDAIPPERLRRFGVGPDKLVQYPGLKEEYYLADFEPDRGVPGRSSVSTSSG